MGGGREFCLIIVFAVNIALPIISSIFVPDVDPAYPKMDIVAHARWVMGILLGVGLIGTWILSPKATPLGRRIGTTILVLVSLGYLACGIAAVKIQSDYCATRPAKLVNGCGVKNVMGAFLILLSILWGLHTLVRCVSVRYQVECDEEKANREEAKTQAASAIQAPAGNEPPPPYGSPSGQGAQEKVPGYEGGDDAIRSSMDKTDFGGVAIGELPRAYHPGHPID